jgi:hypothetical protein
MLRRLYQDNVLVSQFLRLARFRLTVMLAILPYWSRPILAIVEMHEPRLSGERGLADSRGVSSRGKNCRGNGFLLVFSHHLGH